MLKLVADVNIEGQFAALIGRMQRPPWDDLWVEYALSITSFAEIGIPRDANDRVVWHAIQSNGALMITDNRNENEVDSLQAVIRDSNRFDSLPVITVGDIDRLVADRDYADRAIDKLFDYVMNIDLFLGTGRLYIP